MTMRIPTIRYRCPTAHGSPSLGDIVMGSGKQVRRAYRVLMAVKVRSAMVMLGMWTWRLHVEPLSAALGRDEIAAGARHWNIVWDRRGKNV